ncbi:hypothetical protein [Exiguobacterium sp. ERU656]|uniref:hypothetical protein n=1 Tax=Exiguobacterium sp. ERU656 TaxID=2751217 RepID=UPI001BE8A3D2|nr:hypothetical protein [Exiguobacterium sp. ERU656]
MAKKVYIISGPAGVGKSTTSMVLAEGIKRSAYISGDTISHLPVSGREKPWESDRAKKLVWENLIALTKNFIQSDFDVIIDWVISLEDIHTYASELFSLEIEMKFVILWTDEKANLNRDKTRSIDEQMGERVKILRTDFLSEEDQHAYFLDTTFLEPKDISNSIMEEEGYLINFKIKSSEG